jgi:hypothetical protein
MELARRAGLSIGAHAFSDGAFRDAGTPNGLTRARALWAERMPDSAKRELELTD